MEAVGPMRRGTNPSAAASRDAARDSAESNDRVESETSSHVSEERSDGDEGDEDEDEDDDDDEGEADEDEDGDDSPFKLLERQAGAGTDDAEFYSSMIQMLTHVLGSSEAAISWPYQATPGSQLAPSPFGQYGSSPAQTPSQGQRTAVRNIVGSKAELSALQPLIQALIARLGKDQQLPRRPVGEQDLTALLQTLMEQQQRQQKQEQQKPRQGSVPQANAYSASSEGYPQQGASTQAPSNRSFFQDSFVFGQTAQNGYQSLQFADLDFEDEDEDDPDFNPDLNPDLPLPSAWSLAATTQQAEADSTAPRKRGRKPVLEPGEAQRRRAQRNVEYQRMRRQVKKAEESEKSETVLELKAEVKMLRAEMERLRDENAMLRAQRELDRLQRSGPR
ncbi:hypothetical protein NDA16_000451 [Ustilago loliicola]|nr:hypothetical protein NDA16_000451 [Ustilago loliicola]